jgi:23S rRNA pseudouridine1911/1915/1917 synthase
MSDAQSFTFTATAAGERLDLLVAQHTALSRTQAATLIANGHVTVNGRREKASYRVELSDALQVVVPPPPGRDIVPEQIPLDIVYEDEHLLVVD